MKKNIALVTWLGGGNYGTSLQSYALHKKLELLGYHPYFLHYFRRPFDWKAYIKYLLRLLGRSFLLQRNRKKGVKYDKLHTFQQKEYNHLYVGTERQYRELLKKIDVFLTGSDQIWNTYYRYNPFNFLDFVQGKKMVAYASSIGATSVPEEYTSSVKTHLQQFDHIGVREESAVKVLAELTGRTDIVQVLDPTFLLTADEWRGMGHGAVFEFQLPSRYMLCYLIGNNERYVREVEDIKTRLGIENIIIVPSEENPDFMIDGAFVYQNAGPVEFVSLIDNASVVCTDSFHASAISINLGKPFVELLRFNDSDKASQNARIYDLLGHYHLEGRLYAPDKEDWLATIDYSAAQEILSEDREKSLDYLVSSIEK